MDVKIVDWKWGMHRIGYMLRKEPQHLTRQTFGWGMKEKRKDGRTRFLDKNHKKGTGLDFHQTVQLSQDRVRWIGLVDVGQIATRLIESNNFLLNML